MTLHIAYQRADPEVQCHTERARFFFYHGATAPSGPGPPVNERSACRRNLSLKKKQHSQERDKHAPRGIRTRDPNTQAAAYPRLGPRDHWARFGKVNMHRKLYNLFVLVSSHTLRKFSLFLTVPISCHCLW